MSIITATYKIVTPLFLAGAEQKKVEIRLASFKGALRFWWRFLAWSHFQEEEDQRLNAIREKEAYIFGSSDQEIGQASIILRLAETNAAEYVREPLQQISIPFAYLAGQGLSKYQGGNMKMTRPFIAPDCFFTVQGLLRPNRTLSTEDLKLLDQAFLLLGTCGGLGARTRRGMGSIVLQSYTSANGEMLIPSTTERELKQQLDELFSLRTTSYPPYTALSNRTDFKIISIRNGNTSDALLTHLGEKMMMFRSYGRNGRVLRRPAEQNFKDDHDDILKVLQGQAVNRHPKRVGFGLPHNYFFSSIRPAGEAKVDVEPEHSTRRASPLLIHIHEFSPQTFVGVVLFAPAVFLPADDRIKMKPSNRQRTQYASVDSDVYLAVKEFMAYL